MASKNIIVRFDSDNHIEKIAEAVGKSKAKSREGWCRHHLLKAAGVKEALVKKKTADKK